MSTRVNPFANIADPPTFTTKPKRENPVEEETIAQLAEQHKFPSRQPTKSPKAERRKPRIHRTGRNVQFNTKMTQGTIDKIYRLANDMNVPLGEVLREFPARLHEITPG